MTAPLEMRGIDEEARFEIIKSLIRSEKVMESSTEKVCELLNSFWGFYLSGEAVPPVRKTKPVENWKDF